MPEFDIDQLKHAVESQHGGTATLTGSVPVKETYEGQTVWEGVVHVFDLDDHLSATIAYAWTSSIEGSTKRRYFTVLHLGGIRGVPPIYSIHRRNLGILHHHRIPFPACIRSLKSSRTARRSTQKSLPCDSR